MYSEKERKRHTQTPYLERKGGRERDGSIWTSQERELRRNIIDKDRKRDRLVHE